MARSDSRTSPVLSDTITGLPADSTWRRSPRATGSARAPGMRNCAALSQSPLDEKLIYAVASGYGPEGPDAGDPSFDLMGQARSGLMMAVGDPGSPPP